MVPDLPPAQPVVARAVIVPAPGRPFELRSPTVVGRDPARVDAVVDDPTVSGVHAVLSEAPGGGWRLRDLGSRNGTFVDGIRVLGELPLSSHHQLGFGQARVTFLVDHPAHLHVHGRGGCLVRGRATVELDPDELALVHALLAAGRAAIDRSGTSEGFVRAADLALAIAPSPPPSAFAADEIRARARRLERRLAALGEPAVLESCARRGYRLRDVR